MTAFSFPTAGEARDYSMLKAVHQDVCLIKTAILTGMEQGIRKVTVCDTPVNLSANHYQSWQMQVTQTQNSCGIVTGVEINGTPVADLLSIQAEIIRCFTQLGYSVKQIQNPNNVTSFCWEVSW